MVDYGKLNISQKDRAQEQSVIEQIGLCMNSGRSWAFDAGAGAGKTYALVQSLKLLLDRQGMAFSEHGQKILCITYTNAAANEIKARLRNAPLVLISTIHERLWDIIAPYRRELLRLHQRKLKEEITAKQKELREKAWGQSFRDLTSEQKTMFKAYIHTSEFRTRFYQAYDVNAAAFRATFSDIAEIYPVMMRNIANFKKVVQSIYSINDFSNALDRTSKRDCPSVTYDPRLNSDRLAKMHISHDTLLEYAYEIVKKNDRLKQIICDQYPVILVDEFQDTNELVIKTIANVDRYSKKIGHPFLAGYYGDIRQNIYDAGVGFRLFRLHPGLTHVEKTFNRRSSPKIIHVANGIRNDGLKQKSIYTEFPESEVLSCVCPFDAHDSIIEELRQRWNISINEPLHCFELTNELVANESGFESIFSFFKESRYYRQGRNFDLLRDHVLSQDETKLNDVAKILFHLLDFHKKTHSDNTKLSEILQIGRLKSEIRNQINITNVRTLTQKLRSLSGDTLEVYLEQLLGLYHMGDILYDECVHYAITEEINSVPELISYIQDHLFSNSGDATLTEDDLEQDRSSIQGFLRISMDVFYRWYDFISGNNTPGEVIYHTFHSTKGQEFDQVLVFMTSRFGRDAHYFSDLLDTFASSAPAKNDSPKVGAARNLFYVAVTRAIKNLCVVYLVEDQENATNIATILKSIFENVEIRVPL